MVNPGRRIPMRGKSTGSVRMMTPKKLISTVECPIQANVTCASLHFEGSGLAEAGEIGRQVSMVHSRKRRPSQIRTRELGSARLSGAFMSDGNKVILGA